MERETLSAYIAPVYVRLAQFVDGPRWRWKVLALCTISVLLLQFPAYPFLYSYAVAHTQQNPTYEVFLNQIAHPFTNYSTVSSLHESKMTFRLTLPLLAHALHLNGLAVFGLQFLAGLILYWVLLTLVERLTQDRVTAMLIALGASFTYYGGAFLHDVYSLFDTFGYTVLMLLLLSRSPLLIAGLVLAGGFLDERVLVASPLVILWHSLPAAHSDALAGNGQPSLTKASLAVPAGWLLYAALRTLLAAQFHLVTYGGGVGLLALKENMRQERTALGFISSIESFWVLPLLALLVLWQRRQHKLALLLLAAVAPIAAGSFLILDITRSLAYCFPVVLLATAVLGRYFTTHSLRNLAAVVAGMALLMPNYYYQWITYYNESIFEKMARLLLLHYS